MIISTSQMCRKHFNAFAGRGGLRLNYFKTSGLLNITGIIFYKLLVCFKYKNSK